MDPLQSLFCVNSRSGGGLGGRLAARIASRLGADRVLDLDHEAPAAVVDRCRTAAAVIACGGDGTVAWILGLLEDVPEAERPPVGILPLGTGNDLARSLGWRSAAPRSECGLTTWLAHLDRATAIRLDTWVLIMPDGFRTWYNYWSIGEDAAIAWTFDRLRRRHPALCRGSLANKTLYGLLALGILPVPVARSWSAGSLTPPPWTRCLVVSNIASYAGGSHLDRRIDAADGRLDVHALGSRACQALALGGLRSPRRLARVTDLRFRLDAPVPMQVDGEAFLGPAGAYAIRRKGSVMLLRAG